MYKSPISIYETALQTIMEQRENAIFAKVQDAFDVDVDKQELIRALQYDRGQYDQGYRDGKKDAVPKWIPVSESVPEERVPVLVFTDKGTQRVSRLYGDEWYTTAWVMEGVTHWMPLPEPPKEDA